MHHTNNIVLGNIDLILILPDDVFKSPISKLHEASFYTSIPTIFTPDIIKEALDMTIHLGFLDLHPIVSAWRWLNGPNTNRSSWFINDGRSTFVSNTCIPLWGYTWIP